MSDVAVTWHYGLVARVWGEIIQDASKEIGFFGQVIARSGQPVLDAGCGSGRLLVPWLRAGMDVDGCDVSGDMLDACRRRAAAEDLAPKLYQQAMHEIELPRRYRTIIMCGAIGLGGDRRRDLEGLRRCHRQLTPGGALALDNYVPWASESDWARWRGEEGQLPEDWPPAAEPDDRGTFADGTQFEMCARTVDFDPVAQVSRMEMRVRHFVGGTQVASETHPIVLRVYLPDELVGMLEEAGFGRVEMLGDYTDAPAGPGNEVHVLIAQKSQAGAPTGS